MKNKIRVIANSIIIFMVLLIIFECPNTYESLPYIGYGIISVSILMLYRYRKNTKICLLIGVMMIISICFAMSVCLNAYDTAFNWQIDLVNREANIINAKNYLLFLTTISIFIGEINEKEYKITYDYNPIIFLVCFIILIYSLIFGFDRGTIGTYSSNTNVLYEYAIVIFLFAWIYTNNNKYMKGILILYAILYCLQGLIFGDRSSAFPMILMVFLLLYNKKYTIKHILIAGLGGIFLANIIDIFRNTGFIFNSSIIKEVLDRGLFVNTISYSFYGGTQVIRYGMNSTFQFEHFLNYMSSIFTGGSSEYTLTVIANAAGYINKGGGMSHVYFYYWGGYIGTVIFGIIMGKIIRYIYNSDTEITNILKITIAIFLIRWYVYYPVAFFRTAILVPAICYVLCNLFKKIIKNRRNENE